MGGKRKVKVREVFSECTYFEGGGRFSAGSAVAVQDGVLVEAHTVQTFRHRRLVGEETLIHQVVWIAGARTLDVIMPFPSILTHEIIREAIRLADMLVAAHPCSS